MAPRTPREARVWNYLNQTEEWWPIHTWPAYIQTLCLERHKRNRERFTMMFFFLANGLEPAVAASWTLMTDVIRGVPISHGYDDAAIRQVHQIQTQHATGSLYRDSKLMYDMVLGRVVPM